MNNLIVKEVNFCSDTLIAVKDETTGKIYTGVSYICRGLGLSKGQKDRQVENIQTDLVLKKGCRKFGAGVLDSNNEVIAIEIDFIPLWLAKITITPKMQEETPKIAGKLVEYQLKAKDVLAQAFIKPLSKELQAIFVLDNKQQELESKISKVERGLIDVKENSPLYTIECKELQSLVKRVGTKVLGGYKSPAYDNKSLRSKVYSDIQHQLRREFGVGRYEAIKRSQLETARKIVEEYKAPIVLIDEIYSTNRQVAIEM